LKPLAIYNHLLLLQAWLMLLVWPVMVLLLNQLNAPEPEPTTPPVAPVEAWCRRSIPAGILASFGLLLLLLFPIKPVPRQADYAFCQAIDAAIKTDVQAGRKILVSYGAAFYLRAGLQTPPLDQGVSVVELHTAGRDDLLSDFKARVDSHYYDKIYLLLGFYYDDKMTAEINQKYQVQTVIPCPRKLKLSQVMDDCTVLVPRP
jgi:hypothetical protein